jgi:hypothetical protein
MANSIPPTQAATDNKCSVSQRTFNDHLLKGQKFFASFFQERSAFLPKNSAKKASGSFLKKRTKKLLLV